MGTQELDMREKSPCQSCSKLVTVDEKHTHGDCLFWKWVTYMQEYEGGERMNEQLAEIRGSLELTD